MIIRFGSRQAIRATTHLSCRSGEGPSIAAVPLPDPYLPRVWCEVRYITSHHLDATSRHNTTHHTYNTAQHRESLPIDPERKKNSCRAKIKKSEGDGHEQD
jgi:hypothetical protein